jgi:hypothetical protein
MKTRYIITIVIFCLIAIIVTLWFTVFSKKTDSNESLGVNNSIATKCGGKEMSKNKVIAKITEAEEAKIKDDFSTIKDYLDLLETSENDYSITNVSKCVGNKLATDVMKNKFDCDDVLERLNSPNLNSDDLNSAIITAETECGFNELDLQAEHIFSYKHCEEDGYCTHDELEDFFACFIGDGSEENVEKCKSSDRNCPGQCEPNEMVSRNMRARRRARYALMT